jgi:ribosomal protein L7/L12
MNDIRCTFCDTMNPTLQRNCVSCGAELPGAEESAEAQSDVGSLEEEVLRIAQEQGVIVAIKHYREATGAGLAEAKQAVEQIMQGATAPSPVPPKSINQIEQEVLGIVRNHGKITAIKRYRELTGCGLREAKSAVEGLMAQTGTQAPKGAGCGTTVLCGLGFFIGIAILTAC